MTIFQILLAIFAVLILLASLVGYSVCVLAGRADARPGQPRPQPQPHKRRRLIVSIKRLSLKHY